MESFMINELAKNFDEDIIKGKKCPYCNSKTEFIDSSEIYGKSFGMMYICRPCDAYVGCHKNSDIALGRLADSELREAKKQAHQYFDNLWKRKLEKDPNARSLAYRWLASEMELPVFMTHIGMFNVDQCIKVIKLCKPYYKE